MFNTFLLIVVLIVVVSVVAVVSMQASEKWTVGEVIRTPDNAFANLEDYPFEPHYVDSLGYRIHYVDEGPKDGQVILLMHGQPSWSYLYRHMIPILTKAGFRVIAPDNVGFGKSDKPTKPSDHNVQMHIDVMSNFVAQIGLENITLFAQDWGGLIGLRVVPEQPDRFARIMLSNTTLPAMSGIKGWLALPLFRFATWKEGKVQELDIDSGKFSFTKWVSYAKHTTNFDFQNLFQKTTTRELSQPALDGYAAPFPGNQYLSAVRQFPSMVVTQVRQNQRVMDDFYTKWDKPFITAFGSDDGLMAGLDKVWHTTVPGAKNQPHTSVKDANHFIQDDKPEEITKLLIEFINNN